MEWLAPLLVLACLWLLVGPAWALLTALRLGREVHHLRAELAQLRAAARPPSAPLEAAAAAAGAPEPEVAADAAPLVPGSEPASAPAGAADASTAPVPTGAPSAPPVRAGFEQRLAQRWLVWLGGIALALGGAFVVKAAAEQGWLGPVVRIVLAVLLGVGLVGLGERMRRRAVPGYAPAALAAAGVCTLFAAFWAAHAFHGLLPSTITFALLAAVAALAVLLAWSHGPLLAALGLSGAFAVPALVASAEPSPWALLGYLLLPVAGGLAVLRYRGWPWLAWLCLAGAVLWLGLDLLAPWREDPATVAYILALAALFLLAPAWAAGGPGCMPVLNRVATVALAVLSLAILAIHVSGPPTLAASLGLILLGTLPLLLNRIADVPKTAAVAPPLAALAALLLWHLDPWTLGLELTGDPSIALPPLRLVPEAAGGYARWAAAIAALYGLGGLAASRDRAPGLWASLSAAVPVGVLAILYLRLSDLTPSLSWAGLGLALAAAELAAASWAQRRRADVVLAAYAAGTVAALALAFTFALEKAWLTVALTAMLPALGLIWRRLAVPGLRTTALVLAVIVTGRVALDPQVSRLVDDEAPGLGWILYGLGLPLAAFLAASRLFARDVADRLAAALATGALLLWLALGWAVVRWLMAWAGGPATAPLAEWSLHGLVWLVTGLVLLRRQRIAPWRPTLLAALLLCGLGGFVLLGTLLDLNPLDTGLPVGRLPIFNDLLLAYGLPILPLALIARELGRQGFARPAAAVAAAALALGLAWLALELRHAFHGTVLTGDTGPAESWAYTALLLLYAAGLLVAGILLARRALRLASLAVLMLAVAKAFLLDMAGLEGLWRAASFLGLGACLVGIGLVYQRFVFRRPAEAVS